jgi:hypothetical protein
VAFHEKYLADASQRPQEGRMIKSKSKLVRINHFTIGAMAQPPVDRTVDCLLEEPHRAVAESEIGPVSRMGAAKSTHEPRRHGKVSQLNPRFQITGG